MIHTSSYWKLIERHLFRLFSRLKFAQRASSKDLNKVLYEDMAGAMKVYMILIAAILIAWGGWDSIAREKRHFIAISLDKC